MAERAIQVDDHLARTSGRVDVLDSGVKGMVLQMEEKMKINLVSRGGFWFATHPDYPGLMADGKTSSIAVRRFNRSKVEWLRIAKEAGWKNRNK